VTVCDDASKKEQNWSQIIRRHSTTFAKNEASKPKSEPSEFTQGYGLIEEEYRRINFRRHDTLRKIFVRL
jgi:hypothetical protein